MRQANQFKLLNGSLLCPTIMEKKNACANCQRELDVGVEATRVDGGVIGLRGFVPLGDTLYFCSEECLRDYYDLGDLPSVPSRIP